MRDLERMRVPRRYWDATLALAPAEAAQKARKYVSESRYIRGEGLYLWGSLGIGKTALAAVILMELRRRGHTALFVESAELVQKIMSREMFDWDVSWDERVRDVEVLVIDDLGTEHHDAGGAIERILEGVLRGRLQVKKPTIVTSNIAPLKLGPHQVDGRKMAGVYRQKFLSLVTEGLYPIKVDGPNLRHENMQAMASGYE